MTAVDVDALDAARAAATGGPWKFHRDGNGVPHVMTPDIGSVCIPVDTDNDAALIVAAVNALPDLLAEVRRGRALREAVEGLADSLDVDSCDPMPDHRARLLYETAQRLRDILAATDGTP